MFIYDKKRICQYIYLNIQITQFQSNNVILKVALKIKRRGNE